MKDDSPRVRVAAAAALSDIGAEPERAVPELSRSIKGRGADVEDGVVAAIQAIGKKAVEPLMGELRQRRELMLDTLGRLARRMPELLVPALMERTGSAYSLVVRGNAAAVLAQLGQSAAVAAPALIEALQEEDVIFRTLVLDALMKVAHPSPEVMDALLALQKIERRRSLRDTISLWIRHLKRQLRSGDQSMKKAATKKSRKKK